MENKQLKSFKGLVAWQKLKDSVVLIYSITEKFSKSPKFYILNSIFLFVFLYSIFYILYSISAQAATLSVSPSVGAFTVDSIFEVSLLADTQGETLNAIDARLSFPPDKLQLVSPTAGRSIISLWTSQPTFNNQEGVISLQGVIPGGIKVSSGLVTTLTFRVKSIGAAFIKFLDQSKTLLHDGLGTDVLRQTQNGVYDLILPPPLGPIVASETHPDQSQWYSKSIVILKWAPGTDVDGYSYVLNDDPVDFSDDISEGVKNSVVYKNVGDGIHYFHIKALREGVWGGMTHFNVKVDTAPPADFALNISPGKRTISREPVIDFLTTDNFSGFDHYEMKIVPLKHSSSPLGEEGNQPLFIEVASPYIMPELELGTYDIILRAYDKAGNFREVTERLDVVRSVFKWIAGQGIEIRESWVLPWTYFFIIAAALFAALGYLAWRVRRWHNYVHIQKLRQDLPLHLKDQLEDLRRYRKKYGKLVILLFIAAGALVANQSSVLAQQAEMGPPFITNISRNISNEEIFYVGGKTEAAESEVIIYFQNLQNGETLSQSVMSDKQGNWFYRHNSFLSTGNYLLWTQSKIGEETSPPSPQVQMTITPTAIQFGASRLSYEAVYLGIVIFLFFILFGLIVYIVFHGYHGRKKHKEFWKEVKEAEESLRRGFAVLRRDIEAELAVVKKAKFNKSLSLEEKEKEKQLLKDLEWAQRYIGKEIWDIERTEHSD